MPNRSERQAEATTKVNAKLYRSEEDINIIIIDNPASSMLKSYHWNIGGERKCVILYQRVGR